MWCSFLKNKSTTSKKYKLKPDLSDGIQTLDRTSWGQLVELDERVESAERLELAELAELVVQFLGREHPQLVR